MTLRYVKGFLIVLISLSACSSPGNKAGRKTESKTLLYISDKFGNVEKKEIADSLKWIFYCLNYDHLARHIIYETAAITPVKCDPVIWEIKRRKDTTIYYFSSYYQSPSEQYWMVPDEFVGIATIGGRPRYTVGGHFSLEKPETTEEANIFFLHRDSLFTHYIRQYKGEINEWLKAELIRRGITPNYKQQNIWLSLTGNF